MRIYDCVVIDMKTGETVYEESYEYDGPLMLCGGGGTDIEAATPSPTEERLNQMTISNLEQQRAYQAAMEPYWLQSMQMKKVYPTASPEDMARVAQLEQEIAAYDASPTGYRVANQAAQRARLAEKAALDKKYTPTYEMMPEDEYYAGLTDLEKQSYDISKLQGERQIKALKGELDVDPALEQNIADEYKQLQETMMQRLGTGWETSTPGIQALDEFNKRAQLLRSEQRKGEMTTGAAAYLNTMGYLDTAGNNKIQLYSNYANSPLAANGAISQAYQPYQFYAGLNQQANMANAQNSAQRNSALMGAIGSAVGLGGGLAAGKFIK